MSTIEKVPDFSDLKKHYIKILIEKVKLQDVLIYINKEINFEDKMKDPKFDYLISLTLYFDGQYEKAKKHINLIKQKNNYNENIEQLLKKVNEIESVKKSIFKQKKYEEAIEE